MMPIVGGMMQGRKVASTSFYTTTPPELIRDHILDVLDGAENLEELRIFTSFDQGRGFQQNVLQPVTSALSNRPSLRKLHIDGARFNHILPLLHFRCLTEVTIIFAEVSYTLQLTEAFPEFVKHIAPTIEVFRVSVDEKGQTDALALDMLRILCDDGNKLTTEYQ